MFNDIQGNAQGNFNRNLSGRARIKVIGVGGAGNNAVNRMIEAKIDCAEFVVVNTDSQILALSSCPNKIQIGVELTKGLGAGANPEIGRKAAEESKDILQEIIDGTDLLFITAGMGGGTGTGAAPVIAKMARDKKILTVAVVTEPFVFEGKTRMENTIKGIENLKKYVDTLIVIPNDKIRTIIDDNTTMSDALKVADEVLKQGIRGLAELIVNPSLINLDFADVQTILKDKGVAHLGVGVAKGENRILEAVRVAVNSPLLETTIEGARGVILNVVGGNDLTFNEVADAAELVRSVVDHGANIIFGARIDPNVHEEVEITVIATDFTTGFEAKQSDEQQRANGQLYTQQSYSQDKLSVNEPHYPVRRELPKPSESREPQRAISRPVRSIPQTPRRVEQDYVRPSSAREDEEDEVIERPNDKEIPKFVKLLRRYNRRNDDN